MSKSERLNPSARLIEMCDAQESIVMDVSGYYLFWPKESDGAYTSQNLRTIAAELDKRNVGWHENLERAAQQQKEPQS